MPISFILYSISFLTLITLGFFLTKDIQTVVIEAFGLRVEMHIILLITILLLSNILFYAICRLSIKILNLPQDIKKSNKLQNLEDSNNYLMDLLVALQTKDNNIALNCAKSIARLNITKPFRCYIEYFINIQSNAMQDITEKKSALMEMLQYQEITNFALMELYHLMMGDKQYKNAVAYATKMTELFPSENAAELLVHALIMANEWQSLEQMLNKHDVYKLLNKVNLQTYRDMVREKLKET